MVRIVHARRKFTDVLKPIQKKDWGKTTAITGIQYCDALFALERKYDDQKLTPEQRKEHREKESKPIADEFFAWAESIIAKTLPQTPFGGAVRYAVNQKKWLLNFLLDGRLELSNNRAERSIRHFTIGRKNWLFSTSTDGAKASAIVYSIVETAYANGLVPYLYLNYIFEQMPDMTEDRYPELLPWNPLVQKLCAAPSPKSV